MEALFKLPVREKIGRVKSIGDGIDQACEQIMQELQKEIGQLTEKEDEWNA